MKDGLSFWLARWSNFILWEGNKWRTVSNASKKEKSWRRKPKHHNPHTGYPAKILLSTKHGELRRINLHPLMMTKKIAIVVQTSQFLEAYDCAWDSDTHIESSGPIGPPNSPKLYSIWTDFIKQSLVWTDTQFYERWGHKPWTQPSSVQPMVQVLFLHPAGPNQLQPGPTVHVGLLTSKMQICTDPLLFLFSLFCCKFLHLIRTPC